MLPKSLCFCHLPVQPLRTTLCQ